MSLPIFDILLVEQWFALHSSVLHEEPSMNTLFVTCETADNQHLLSHSVVKQR